MALLDGKVALVTGAGGGLGREHALALAKAGAKVVVNDLGGARDGSGTGSKGMADHVVDEIKAAGGEAIASYDNVADVAAGERIVKSAIDAYGKLDILREQRRHSPRQDALEDGRVALGRRRRRAPEGHLLRHAGPPSTT